MTTPDSDEIAAELVQNGDGSAEGKDAVNGETPTSTRAAGTKTPPTAEQRQTPPLSVNTRAPTVRKRCSAIFSGQMSSSSRGGGLSALTSALGKKPRKQSVLDTAATDWRAFVQEEQLEGELESHLRSKDAYLDKQEFLLRADYSQFERERDLRAQERRVQQQQGNKPS
uniref:Craniofacial development protein 1 n=1 Tax=Globodera rostochiensis TaxID=31243 RepID=A0A914HNR8_GLORO